ncbi:MAG: PKD domain-containing protein [Candidatus Bathyarchaeia archaeon]
MYPVKGDPLEVNVTIWFSGTIEYFDGATWQPFIKPTMTFLEGTYTFRFSDQTSPSIETNLTLIAPSVEKTVAYIRLLKSDGVSGQPGATARWWDYGKPKQDVPGETNNDGVLLCLMDGKHTDVLIEMTFEDATAPFKRQNPTTNSFYIFQMTKVTVELRNHAGFIIPDNSTVNYYWPYGGTERIFGILSNGRASKDLLMPNPPGFVYLIKDFQKSRQQIGPTLNTTVVFRTGKVVDGGFGCDIYWQYGGPTATFYDGIELLPGNFYFKDIDTNTVKNFQVKAGQILNLQTGTYSPPEEYFYLTVITDPENLTTIPREGWYVKNTYVELNAPDIVFISDNTRYKFSYWDLDGEPQGVGVNPITVFMDVNHTATAHYVLQYYLTVTSPFGTVDGEGWYQSGATAYATLDTGLVDHGNGTRRVFVSWGGDASGTNYAQSNPIVMNAPKTAVANWKTQYLLTVVTDPAGLSPQPTRNPTGEAGPPNSWWYDADTSVTLTAQTVSGYNFNYWDVNGLSQGTGVNPITVVVNTPKTATAHYVAVTYTLIIETTPGGSTNPMPGAYSYAAGSQVEVTAIPSSGYVFDHWELNGTNVGTATTYTVTMNANYVLKAFFRQVPPLTVSISPMSASILIGQQVTFTSTVSGGIPPYTYQWYVNNQPVPGATSSTFTFTPTAAGTYYVVLKVTDAAGNTAQSDPAKVTASSIPVGGYSISLYKNNWLAIPAYILIIILLTTILCSAKNGRKH